MSLVFEESKKPFSHNECLISGIKVYTYHSQLRNPLKVSGNGTKLRLLFLMHGRLQDSVYIKSLSTKILELYEDSIPLVVFNFDHRNHGERTVDSFRNKDWTDGNSFHAQDMLSMIDGGVADLKVIMEYLPSYFPKLLTYNVTRIVSGVSMGGHTAIRYASLFSDTIDAAIPIVGCFDLTSLLLNRLHPFEETRLHRYPYDIIKSKVDEAKYPEPLFIKSASEDQSLLKGFQCPVLALFGELDNVVPLQYSLALFEHFGVSVKHRDHLSFDLTSLQAIKYPAKHSVTYDMVHDFANWLKVT